MTESTTATPSAERRARGLGVLSGALASIVLGAADAVLAATRSPPGALTAGSLPWLLAQCVCFVAVVGVLAGSVLELLLASWLRSPPLRALARYLTDGPRRWFASDPLIAQRVVLASVGLGVALGPVFPLAYYILVGFHSQLLAALAVTLLAAGFLAIALVLLSAIAAPLGWLLRRVPFVARPGALALLALTIAAVQWTRLLRAQWSWLRELEAGGLLVTLAFLISLFAALLVGGAVQRRRTRALRKRTLAVVALAPLLALLLPALTLGRRQTAATALVQRTALAGPMARWLRRATDRDHDGYSALFGGGDCNDRDPRVHPGARDVPGNGIDENCSGHDARFDREEGGGALVPLPLTLPLLSPSFVLLSLEALRPDHLGAYGYRRATSPNLDALAREGAVFLHAYSASPRSVQSLAAVWTGRYPSLMTWWPAGALAEQNVTLAEQLQAGGYHRAAFVTTSDFAATRGFYQGFDEHRDAPGARGEGELTVNQLRAWLQVRDLDPRPFFAWTHLMEPSAPYESPRAPQHFGTATLDRYDEAIARADQLLGMVLRELRAMARRRPLYVVVMGAQGEGFDEHGVAQHGDDLHDEAMHVPLVVWGIGVLPGARVALTSLLDLHPTLLNLARLGPGAPVSGLSLTPVLFSAPPGVVTAAWWRSHVYGELLEGGRAGRSVLEWPSALLHREGDEQWELFDLASDPGERRNLYDARPELARALRERLLGFSEGASAP